VAAEVEVQQQPSRIAPDELDAEQLGRLALVPARTRDTQQTAGT
jgi:hypothetical protein